jgi:hypothetical protein
MKILSKYKDYYDYLSGVWGEDPKLILERKGEFVVENSNHIGCDMYVLTFIIGGNMVQIYNNGEDFYFSKDIKQFDTSNKWYKKEGHYRVNIGYINGRRNNMFIADSIKSGYEYLNDKYNCPIIYNCKSWYCSDVTKEDFSKYPLLSSTPITKFVTSQDVYRWIQEYLAKKIDQSQARQDNQTDIQKIENKGFDKIKSFRKMN